jgi:chemotaxis protein MotB
MARRRRKIQVEDSPLDRWLISYADFITLLFAFFVVMYAISSVNEGKYRVLSETLNEVFSVSARSDKPIQVGEPPRDVLALPDAPLAVQRHRPAAQEAAGAEEGGGPASRDGNALRIADELAISLQNYLDQGLMRIKRDGDRVEIEMAERMLFGSGEARLSADALVPLRALARTLARIPSHLQVEGHTDNVPISTATFPSNWELSAARAASVVHFLARSGVEPWRMSAVGLGEHRPIAENSDAKGRATNRRVKVVVLTGQRESAGSLVDEDVPWAEGPALERR